MLPEICPPQPSGVPPRRVIVPPMGGVLLERDAETAVIEQALASACDGRGNVLFVEGTPGAGKSRLLEAARRGAVARGMAVRVAYGSELERDVAFGVARQLFVAAPPGGGLWSDAGDAPAADQHRMLIRRLHGAVLALVRAPAGAAPAPLLLAVDDVHCADEPTLGFLAHLALRVPELPVALLMTLRTGDPVAALAPLDALRTAATHRTVRLRPLSAAAVATLARAQLGEHADDALCRACVEATAGNPFYVRELLRTLAEDGVPLRPERVRELAPDAVLRSVAVRIGRLGDAAAAVARAAAVLGDGAPLAHVARLAGLDDESAEAAADALARATVLRPGEPVRFEHPLVRSSVAADMGSFAWRRAHRQAARLLREAGVDDERVAPHLLLARPAGDRASVAVLRRAARTAARRGDPAAAARLLRRALDEPPPAQERPALLLALARVESLSGSPQAVATFEAAVRATHDPRERAEAFASLAMITHMNGDLVGAVELARRGRAELAADDPLAARLLAIEASAATLHPSLYAAAEQLLAPLTEAALAGEVPSEPTLAVHLAGRLGRAGPPAAVRRLAEAAIAGDPLIDPEPQGVSIGWLGAALGWVDELTLAEGWLADAVAAADRRGAVLAGATARLQRGSISLLRGRLADAVADLEAALETYRWGWTASPWSTPMLVSAHVARGDLAAAAEALATGERARPETSEYGLLLLARAELDLARGDAEAALAAARACEAHIDERYGVALPRIHEWRRWAALALARLERPDEGRDLLAPALAELRAIGPARQLGAALVAAGLVAEDERRLDLLEEAVTVLQESPARLERGRALLELGAAQRRRGRRSAARDALLGALELGDQCEARPLVDAARDELRRLGLRPRRAARSGLDALTPSERRIAELAARGLTTPQIGQELHITRKTVETHLGHVYSKLGVAGRRELPAAMAEDVG